MRSKIKSYFGFSIRSNAAMFGLDQIVASKKKPKLVVYDETLSENSRNKLGGYCERGRIPLVGMKNLSELLSNDSVLAVGVTNENLASAILAEIEKETVNGNGKSE